MRVVFVGMIRKLYYFLDWVWESSLDRAKSIYDREGGVGEGGVGGGQIRSCIKFSLSFFGATPSTNKSEIFLIVKTMPNSTAKSRFRVV